MNNFALSYFYIVGGVSSGQLFRVEIAELKASTCQILLRFSSEGFINLKVAIFPKSQQQSVLSCFLVFASLTSKKWYLSLTLICFSLIMSDFEHFLMFEGHLYILFFVNFLFIGLLSTVPQGFFVYQEYWPLVYGQIFLIFYLSLLLVYGGLKFFTP